MRGFSCPKCSRSDTKVIGGERRGQVRARFRRCLCGHSFATIETAKHTRHTVYAEAVDTLTAFSEILDTVQQRIAVQLDYLEKVYGKPEANRDDLGREVG